MKLFLIKLLCFFSGCDWRLYYPDKWDLSRVRVWKEYGGNEGFISYYNSQDRIRKFSNGLFIEFYDDTFIVKRITGCTNSAFCSVAVNKKAFINAFRT
jgi:hypothetical protein